MFFYFQIHDLCSHLISCSICAWGGGGVYRFSFCFLEVGAYLLIFRLPLLVVLKAFTTMHFPPIAAFSCLTSFNILYLFSLSIMYFFSSKNYLEASLTYGLPRVLQFSFQALGDFPVIFMFRTWFILIYGLWALSRVHFVLFGVELSTNVAGQTALTPQCR